MTKDMINSILTATGIIGNVPPTDAKPSVDQLNAFLATKKTKKKVILASGNRVLLSRGMQAIELDETQLRQIVKRYTEYRNEVSGEMMEEFDEPKEETLLVI